jgi:hypothetical protein
MWVSLWNSRILGDIVPCILPSAPNIIPNIAHLYLFEILLWSDLVPTSQFKHWFLIVVEIVRWTYKIGCYKPSISYYFSCLVCSGSKSAIVTNTTIEIVVPEDTLYLVYGENGSNLARLRQVFNMDKFMNAFLI